MKENKNDHHNAIQQVLDSYCQVCFVPFNKIAPRKLDEGEEICYCVKCKCRVHKCCYDMELNSSFVTPKLREFICQRCEKKELNDKSCIICHKKEGALKIIDGDQLVHVFCALMHKDIITTGYYPELTFKKSADYKQIRNLCGLCSKPNATEQCSMESCMKRYHGYCIWLNLKAKQLEQEEPQCSKYYLSTGDNGKFDLTGELMPRTWVYEQFDKVLASFEQYGFKVHNNQKIKNDVYNKYEKQEKQQRDDSTLKRGGFAYILCDEHDLSVYCNCFNKGSGDMVLCQCCFQWYHQKCVGYEAGKNTKNGDNYICSYCQNFYDLKKKIIDQVRSSKTEHYQLKFQPPKMHLNDYIWILRVIDHRIAGGGAVKMIKQLAKYPLKTSKMDLVIRSQNKKKMVNLVEVFTQQYLQSEEHQALLKPKPVLGLDRDQKPIVLQQNVEHNKQLKKYIDFLQNFVKRNNQTDSFGSIIHQLKFKQRAIQNSYETILQLSKSQSGYSQIPILKMKVQEYSFMEVIKNIGSGSIIDFKQLQQALQKAKNSQNVPGYLKKPLIQRYDRVKKLVELVNKNIYSFKECSAQTQNAVKKLRQQNISAPQSYKNFHQERRFIKELYLSYLKQQGKPLEESVDTNDKIQTLLREPACKPNREIAECVNQFRIGSDPVHDNIGEIVEKYSKICVLFDLKDVLKKGITKLSVLQNLYAKYEKLKISESESEIKNFIQKWKKTRQLWISTKKEIESTISQLDDIVGLSNEIKNIQETIKSLANLPVEIADKAEEVPQLGSINKLERLKSWLDTLIILLTESQLPKNPMTVSRLPQGIPKQNRLVQQYFSLKKQQNELINKYNAIYSRINEKIEILRADPKKARKQQMKDNLQKPRMTDVNNFIDQLKQSKISMQNQIKQLTKSVNKSIQIGSRVNKFIAQQKHVESLFKQEQIDAVKKQIDQLRRKVLTQAEISLQNQLKQLYQAQICIRMQKMIITTNVQLDKMNKLLKFAEEEGLNHLSTYKRLKSKFDVGNESNKQITLTKKHQQMLNTQAQRMKDSDNFYSSLVFLRKSLPLSLPLTLKQRNKHYEDLIQRNEYLRKKIQFILCQQPKKYEIQQAKTVYLQALKHPFEVQGLSKLIHQFQKTQKLLSIYKQNKQFQDSRDQLFLRCDDLIFHIEDIQKLRKNFQQCEARTIKVKQLKQNLNLQSLFKVEQNYQFVQQSDVSKISRTYNRFKIQYYNFWIKSLQKIKNQGQFEPIAYFKVKAMLVDIYMSIQRNFKGNVFFDEFKQIINYFEDIMVGIRNLISQKGSSVEPIYEGFIDIYELKYEVELGYDIKEEIKILNPYNDMIRFTNLDLRKALFRQAQAQVGETIALKRQRTSNSQMDDPYLRQSKSQKTHNKLIKSESKIENEGQTNQKLEDWEKNDTSIVNQAQRAKAKQVIFKNIKKNREFSNIENMQEQVKMIENQLFGDNHNHVVKYFQFVNSFEKLFIKLVSCPNISIKVAKKKFQWSFLKLLIENIQQINQIQSMLIQKNKQTAALANSTQGKKDSTKQQKQKTKQKEAKKQQQTKPKQRTIQQMIASGNVDQSVRRQMKKQIKAIREKNKKKKHKSSRRRSRSKSSQSSPDVQFSSDSQEKKLPGFIEKQYIETIERPLINQFLMPKQAKQAPLLYDPQAQEFEEAGMAKKNFPKGSVLQLRSSDLQFSLKKKGKVVFKSLMFSTEDYFKVVNELVDPGFALIQLKRDKPELQIIQYLSKPSRKKYQFLVGWFQAEKKQDNQNIRDFAYECNDKKKIYGVQNDHIKMHVMSIHQYVRIIQLHDPPNKVTTQSASEMLQKDRLVYVIQYPTDRMHELKNIFQNFNGVEKIENIFNVQVPVPQPIITAHLPIPDRSGYIQNPYMMGYNPLVPQQPVKIIEEDPLKPAVYEGWGSNQTITPTYTPATYSNQSFNPLNQLSRFSPIMTDEEDYNGDQVNKEKAQQKQKQVDLASNILNSLSDVSIKAPEISLPPRTYPMESHPAEDPYDYKRYQPMQHPQHIAAGMGPGMGMGSGMGMGQGMHPQHRWQPTGMMPPQMQMGRVGMPINPMNPMSIQSGYPMTHQGPSPMMYKNPMSTYSYPPPQNQQRPPPGNQYDPYWNQRQQRQ